MRSFRLLGRMSACPSAMRSASRISLAWLAACGFLWWMNGKSPSSSPSESDGSARGLPLASARATAAARAAARSVSTLLVALIAAAPARSSYAVEALTRAEVAAGLPVGLRAAGTAGFAAVRVRPGPAETARSSSSSASESVSEFSSSSSSSSSESCFAFADSSRSRLSMPASFLYLFASSRCCAAFERERDLYCSYISSSSLSSLDS
mmetsp:Transcript_45314/g.106023  ORF Transcript_45314/g.106023 Transcript_45314/m.106023 type:complete len:208 (+) Transcript_45314:400-1023(+)